MSENAKLARIEAKLDQMGKAIVAPQQARSVFVYKQKPNAALYVKIKGQNYVR